MATGRGRFALLLSFVVVNTFSTFGANCHRGGESATQEKDSGSVESNDAAFNL